jgi:hypothetical protein
MPLTTCQSRARLFFYILQAFHWLGSYPGTIRGWLAFAATGW